MTARNLKFSIEFSFARAISRVFGRSSQADTIKLGNPDQLEGIIAKEKRQHIAPPPLIPRELNVLQALR